MSPGNLGVSLLIAGQLKDARAALDRSLSINPDDRVVKANVARVELLENRPQEALILYQQVGGPAGLSGVAMAEHSLGHAGASQHALDELIAKYAETDAMDIGATYAWRGEKDKAFEWVERAHAQHDFHFIGIKFNPLFAALRGDARYRSMVKKLGLPEAGAQPPVDVGVD